MTPTILHVNAARGYRGGERQTELLIRGLAPFKVRQVLVARRGGDLAAKAAAYDIDVREVAGGLASVVRATRDAALVHVHEGRSVYAAYLRSLLSHTPYVITRRVDNRIGDHWIGHRAYRRAACVAAISPQVGEIVRAYDAAIRIGVIHSASSGFAVDVARSAAIRASFVGKLLVGHVAALDNAQKGQEFTIAVAREVERTHPDIQFVLVGSGQDDATLRAAARGLSNVTFTGFVENVGDYLAALDVLILPSNREGLGSILLDAMEQALPIVASRVGGIPDVVRHGENGLLIDPASPAQLRDAILALRADAALRRSLGDRGRELAKKFTAEVMARRYLELYESVLGRSVTG